MAQSLFFGYMGGLNLVTLFPVGALLWLGGALDLSAVSGRALGVIACKGLFDNVLSDYLWARAVLLVGPTIATVGISVQVRGRAGARDVRPGLVPGSLGGRWEARAARVGRPRSALSGGNGPRPRPGRGG